MPLADYLAKNYLSADPSSTKPKKRKRKEAAAAASKASGGFTINDDDPNDWTNPQPHASDSDENNPTIFNPTALSGGLNKPSKKTKWIKLGTTTPSNSEQAAADALLATAQAETAARQAQDDSLPTIVDGDAPSHDDSHPIMSSGATAGLQSAAQVSAALQRKERAERKAMHDAGLDPTGKAQETIYRDASGRIINVAMKRAELRAKADEEERQAVAEEESRRGDVQRREKEARREALRDVRTEGFARGADDEGLNRELKARERWNDPMAALVTRGKETKGKKAGGKAGGKTYQGAAEPNRYGIRPGWRWDGVDRSNGFERKWFAARNKARDRQELEYAWQMDD